MPRDLLSGSGGRPLVLVDARNVMRSRWPNVPEDRLVGLVRAWAEREQVRATIVFDGTVAAHGTGVSELDERTSVVGTGSRSADDWIADQAARLAGEGRRLWLVSSDRDLRLRVAPHVERTIGGGSFVARLHALERTA